MPLVSTSSIVLSALRYSESSKIVRLATREHGVQSVGEVAVRRHAVMPVGSTDVLSPLRIQLTKLGVAGVGAQPCCDFGIATPRQLSDRRAPVGRVAEQLRAEENMLHVDTAGLELPGRVHGDAPTASLKIDRRSAWLQ